MANLPNIAPAAMTHNVRAGAGRAIAPAVRQPVLGHRQLWRLHFGIAELKSECRYRGN